MLGPLGKLTSLGGVMMLFLMAYPMFAVGAGMGAEAAINESVSPWDVTAMQVEDDIWRSFENNSSRYEFEVIQLTTRPYLELMFGALDRGVWFGFAHPVAGDAVMKTTVVVEALVSILLLLMMLNRIRYFGAVRASLAPLSPIFYIKRLLP